MTMQGIPISIRALPSLISPKKINIIELMARYQNKDVYSYGVSCVSKDIAYAKCVAEIIERIYIPNFEEGGIGVGFDKERAQLTALYELIERDAFMPYFLLGNIPIRRIDTKIISLGLKKLGLEGLPLKYSFISFDITNDIQIPSILTVIYDKNVNFFSVGIKSNVNPMTAFIGSLEEAILEVTLKTKYGKRTNKNEASTFSATHFKSLFMHEKKHIISTLQFRKMGSSLKSIHAYLRRQGLSVSYRENAPSFLKGLGYHVITTSSNSFQKIFFSERRRDLNKKRLENIERYYTIMKQNYEKNNTLI